MSPWQEAIQLLKSSKHTAILLGQEPTLDAFSAGAALSRTLKSRGQAVNVLAGPAESALPEFISRELVNPELEPPRDFIISFDLERSPVKELKYERGEKRLDIILSPQSGRILKDDVQFGYGPIRYDLILTLGVEEIRSIEPVIEEVPELLHEKTIINLDYHEKNTNYGDINLIETKASTLGEVVWKLLKEWGDPKPEAESATLLLFGLTSAKPDVTIQPSNLGVIECLHELLEAGARTEILSEAKRPISTNGQIQLLGRALARSRFDAERKILWAIITQEDFLATKESASAVSIISRQLKSLFPIAESRIILWQHPLEPKIHAEISTDDKDFLHDFGSSRDFESFGQAESTIQALL